MEVDCRPHKHDNNKAITLLFMNPYLRKKVSHPSRCAYLSPLITIYRYRAHKIEVK